MTNCNINDYKIIKAYNNVANTQKDIVVLQHNETQRYFYAINIDTFLDYDEFTEMIYNHYNISDKAYNFISIIREYEPEKLKEDIIYKMHPNDWDEDYSINLIKKVSDILRFLPANNIGKKTAEYVAKNLPFNIRYLNKRYRTADLLMKAISSNPSVICLLQPEEITYEMAILAVKFSSFNIKYIPTKFRDIELIKMGITETDGYCLDYLDENEMKEEIALYAVSLNPNHIFRITKQFRTKEVIKTTIEKDPDLIYLLSSDNIDEDILYIALEKQPSLIKAIQTKCISPKIVKLFNEKYPEYLKTIQPKILQEENNDDTRNPSE